MPLDQDIARTAAEQANKLFGQWMPESWLNLFIDAYDDIEACREVDRIMKMSEGELAAELAKDGETIESVAAQGRAAFERALAVEYAALKRVAAGLDTALPSTEQS
jgi:hypothetical protein